MTDSKAYRPDIDGLRAIAVLAVVLFHLEPRWLPGGFAGVDIFFVISGFLITGIVSRQVEAGSFSFSEFYRRRIKRIVPVLACVILTTLVVGQLLLTPEDLQRLSVSALASQLFVGNVYFTYFLDTGYFADDASLEPLLHIWSLGVEEQFYFFWPMMLVWLATWRRRSMPVLIVFLIAAASFLLPVLIPSIDRMFLYYMLPARVGELSAGALCYSATARTRPISQVVATLGAWLGLALVALSLVLLSSENLYPGLWGIPVCLGTALLIYSGTRDNLVSRVLSVRFLVGIGLISYSMYLWHWPVLAYVKYSLVDVDVTVKLAALIGITTLSYLSYRFVEQPFRSSEQSFCRIFATQFMVPTILVSSVSGFFLLTAGYGLFGMVSDYSVAYSLIEAPGESANSDSTVCQNRVLTVDETSNRRCIINGQQEPPVLLWGDSNASHYVGTLRVLAKEYDFSFRNLAQSSCAPLLKQGHTFKASGRREDCSIPSKFFYKIANDYDKLILAASWDSYLGHGKEAFEQAFAETIQHFVRTGKQVVILGRIPRIRTFDRKCERRALKIPSLNCAERGTGPDSSVRRVNSRIELLAETNGATYVDFNDLICSDGECSAYVNNHPMYYNSSHLSSSGSTRLGQMLIGSDTALLLDELLSARAP